MNESLYDFCRRNGRSGLLDQWDTERNGADTPRTVSYGSQRKIWWRCEKGHIWQAPVYSRTGGAGCPYCTGRKVVHPGFNDLASKAPAVAAQWHPALNGGLTPEMVTVSSHRRVWWQCPQGHVLKALVYSRTGEQKCGCPVCGGSLDGARRARYEQSLRETAGICDTDALP